MKNQKKVFQSLTLILQFGLNMIVPIVLCMMFGLSLIHISEPTRH